MALAQEDKDFIAAVIVQTVNGKIDKIDKKLDGHIEQSTQFMADMKPLKDALATAQNLNRFFKWLGIPSIVAFVSWLIFIRG